MGVLAARSRFTARHLRLILTQTEAKLGLVLKIGKLVMSGRYMFFRIPVGATHSTVDGNELIIAWLERAVESCKLAKTPTKTLHNGCHYVDVTLQDEDEMTTFKVFFASLHYTIFSSS